MTQSGLDYNILAPATAVIANAGDIIEIDYPTNCPELTNLGQIVTSLAAAADVLATGASNIEWNDTAKRVTCVVSAGGNAKTIQIAASAHPYVLNQGASFALTSFPLTNIDDMRDLILRYASAGAFKITSANALPYSAPMQTASGSGATLKYGCQYSQNGLGIKTYQSDLHNNWG